MTAGVVKVAKPARCGCCNALNPWARCDNCDEPMCGAHFVRTKDADGDEWFICTVCAEQLATEQLQAAGAAEVVA